MALICKISLKYENITKRDRNQTKLHLKNVNKITKTRKPRKASKTREHARHEDT